MYTPNTSSYDLTLGIIDKNNDNFTLDNPVIPSTKTYWIDIIKIPKQKILIALSAIGIVMASLVNIATNTFE